MISQAGDALDRVLREMSPVGLKALESRALMKRIDTKYTLTSDWLPQLLRGVRDEYNVLCTGDALLAPYRTTYFDTDDRLCYQRHHNNHRSRHKVRVRQYQTTGVMFLEVKEKTNKGRTVKSRCPVEELPDRLGEASQEFVDRKVGDHHAWRPVLNNEFLRITLAHKQRVERATIDLDLTFSNGGRPLSLPSLAIVEVKQESDDRHSPLREGLRKMLVRPARVSKYCLGSMLLDPGLKRNRFKSQLRLVHRHTEVA